MNEPRFNKRMEDKFEVPEMNGTLQEIVTIISGPLKTQKQNAEAIRNISKVVLHSYLLNKKILEELTTLTARNVRVDKTFRSVFVDKVLPQFVSFSIMGILWLLFTHFKP